MALVALETLSSTTGDDNLGRRIQINFDEVIQRFAEYITSLNSVDYFEFIVGFIQKFHGQFTVDNLRWLLDALVLRIIKEHESSSKKSKKTLDLRKGNEEKAKKGKNKNS